MENLLQELGEVEAELVLVEEELQALLTRQSSLVDRKAALEAAIAQNDESSQEKDTKIWEGTDFPWTADLDNKLRDVFRLSSLRPMQRQTMNATLSKQDTLLIMPTGGGKSLCFQLPALVDKGLTLVVSPLVSLMEDQQMALEQLGVPSAMLNAAATKEHLKFVQDDMVSAVGGLKLLYVTPEKLAKSKRFMNRLEKCYSIGRLARIVIDEVHCCSQWGHDFRPDYKFLGIMKRQFPNAPILGLTATATTALLDDVKKILNIPRALLFKASFNRPNLYYAVRQKPSSQKETMDEIHKLICKRFHNQSGIVYCFSRKETEEVTSDLMSRGIKAGCYHADMDAPSRSRVHRCWLQGQIQVVVATVAFGMGIDKPDVRFVIHHSISKSMENLYQESGRAGRDDKRADCVVFYRLADVARQSSMVFTEQTGLQKLHGIVNYCIDMTKCRRSVLANHFGEVWDSSHCSSMCDHCEYNSKRGEPKAREVTKYCQDVLAILDAAAATEQRVTSAKLVDAWYGRGPSGLKVKSVAIPALGKDMAERVLAHMLVHGYLQEDFHFTAYSTICYVIAGNKARLLRSNLTKVYMDFRGKSDSASPTKSPVVSTTIPSSPSSLSTPSSDQGNRSTDSQGNRSTDSSKSQRSLSSAEKSASQPKTHSSFSKSSTGHSSTPTTSKHSKNPEKLKVSPSNGKTERGSSEEGKKSKNGAASTSARPVKVSSQKMVGSKPCSKSSDSRVSSSSSKTNDKAQDKTGDGKSPEEGGAGTVKKVGDTQTRVKLLSKMKRQFVFSDDLDDEEDFDIKKPRSKDNSIVISDGSDSEHEN